MTQPLAEAVMELKGGVYLLGAQIARTLANGCMALSVVLENRADVWEAKQELLDDEQMAAEFEDD